MMTSDHDDFPEQYTEEIRQPQQQQPATPTPDIDSEAGNTPWPAVSPEVYHGLPGRVVATIAPHTEASDIGVLLHYLTSAGNVIGRGPYFQVEGTKHFANLFTAFVGRTARSRKGTTADRVRRIFEAADPDWLEHCVHSGMSSGEGLLMPIRDPIFSMRRGEEEVVDPGVEDKRLLLDEREFSAALRVMRREGNIVSRVVRDLWDCREVVGTLTKHSRIQSTHPYVSIVAHITAHELRELLDHTSMLNGFGNRFLIVCVRRSKELPHGGALPEQAVVDLGRATLQAIEQARAIERVTMTPEAAKLWEVYYSKLTEDVPGLIGSMTARAEAHTIRLALLYALLDGAAQITPEHLDAAMALWSYCEASARFIFGDMVGEPIADTCLRGLRAMRPAGMAQTDVINLFGRNIEAAKIYAALARLLSLGKVRFEVQRVAGNQGGRPRTMWHAV
jgi:hypothetical protein